MVRIKDKTLYLYKNICKVKHLKNGKGKSF